MVFSALVQAANKLAATILPSNATPIPPVQQAFTLADTEGSRARLQGAIARAPGLLGAHVYYLIPDALSLLTARSKSLSLSDDGDATSATDRSEAAFLALNIADVAYGIIRASAKPGDLPFTVGGTSYGAVVTIDPVIGTPFTSLKVTIGVGAPQVLSIAQAVGLVAAQWIPWAGTPGAPPAIPVQAGIPTIAAADATTIDQTTFLGDATGPARAMREASLNLVLTGLPTTCAHTASFVAGIIDQNIGRPLSVALASIQPPANAADGAILTAARLAAPSFLAALTAVIDSIAVHHSPIIAANANLAAHGVTVGLPESGRHIGIQLQSAEARKATAPTVIAAPAPDPLAAAIAAAIAAATPGLDPFQIEARRLLTGAAGLTQVQLDAAVISVSASLRSIGFVPPPPHLPPIPPWGASLLLPGQLPGFLPPHGLIGGPPPPAIPPWGSFRGIFHGLVAAGFESLPAPQIVHAIADAFGKADSDLILAISAAAGRPPPDAFFSGDTDGLATQAAENWSLILSSARAFEIRQARPSELDWTGPPTSWLEAGRRLRLAADIAREASAAPRPVTNVTGPSQEAADKSAIPKSAASAKARATAASGAIIGCLTSSGVVAAEAAAVKIADPIGEARRIRDASYGGPALTYLLSDGTASGTMPNKCKPPISSIPRTHIVPQRTLPIPPPRRGPR